MGSAMSIGLALGGLSAATSFLGSAREAANQRAQADAYRAQADAYRAQAMNEAQAGRVEAERIEARKLAMRREFEEKEAANRVNLGAGNVDMTSGSALDVSLGNIDRFSADVGENAYDRALSQWETRQKVRNLNYQADAARAQASWLGNTAANFWGPGLLTAAINGANGFVGGYTTAGGKLASLWPGGKSRLSLFEQANRLSGMAWKAALK